MKLQLRLYHGRDTLHEELDSWGSEATPIIIESFGFTYNTLWYYTDDTRYELTIIEDMVYYGGKYYGDFEITFKE